MSCNIIFEFENKYISICVLVVYDFFGPFVIFLFRDEPMKVINLFLFRLFSLLID